MTFFAMGGYAAYVWPAVGGTAVVMIALLVATVRTLRVREARLRLLEEADDVPRETGGEPSRRGA